MAPFDEYVLYSLLIRSASVQLQTDVATRLVTKVDQPNLLLDPLVEWTHPPIFTPRLNTRPVGWGQFSFGDREVIQQLGLPEVTEAEGQDLYGLATGPYAINRGQVALTATREYELRQSRADGHTGSLADYNELASQLPQHTRVLHSIQSTRPQGYNEAVHGPWPGPMQLIKCQIPSSHKSPSNRSNLNTVTLAISTQHVPDNPLLLSGSLSRLFSYHCTCKSGQATNRACGHVMGLCIGLFAPNCFKTTKKKVGRLTDISLPVAQQPHFAGKVVKTRRISIVSKPIKLWLWLWLYGCFALTLH